MNRVFLEYQLMYLFLESINEKQNAECIINFLADANPYMNESEDSIDGITYKEFQIKYYSYKDHEDYSYEFILDYFKYSIYYDKIYDKIKDITKDEYINFCNEIIKNKYDLLKEPVVQVNSYRNKIKFI